MRKSQFVLLAACILILGCTCTKSTFKDAKENKGREDNIAFVDGNDKSFVITEALAVVSPLIGTHVHGSVAFFKVENGIRVVADIFGLSPGKHPFHIHEYGKCGREAGPIFFHFEDLVAEEDGHAHFEHVYKDLTFSGEKSIIGRAVMVHNSNLVPVGCGIIKAVVPSN